MALHAAEALWKAKALASYRFTYEPSCFCPRTKLVVTVVAGAVTAVKIAPGQDEGAGSFVPVLADAPTVDTLFADLRRAYGDAERAADVRVTYDPDHGFPMNAYIDWEANAADEETSYSISNLAPAPALDVVGTWLPEKDNGAFIAFRDDGTYLGSDGCNGASGTWSIAAGKLGVETGPHTEIGCDNQPLDEWIAAADSLSIEGEDMTINLSGTKRVLHRGMSPSPKRD